MISRILLAGALLFGASNSYAEVVYTDITDVTYTVHGNQHPLDLDGDATVDFTLELFSAAGADYSRVFCTTHGTNQAGIDSLYPTVANIAWGLDSGAVLDASFLTWTQSGGTGNEIFLGFFTDGTFFGGQYLGQEKYLPLKFEISGNTHYGWVRVAVDFTATSFTVMDYAYEDQAGQPITIGFNWLTSIPHPVKRPFNVFPNPATDELWINTSSTPSAVAIYDMNGSLVRTELQARFIDVSDLSRGQYIIECLYHDGVIRRTPFIKSE